MPWQLVGQERAIATLTDMVRSQRLPHALMFYGPTGTGKYTLALDMARAINCESPGLDLSPCLECRSCRKIANGSHPDVLTVTPKGKLNLIPIDDIRELRQNLSFMPFEANCKVAIIRRADRFIEEAGGALLKTLEEPTPDTLLILTAESPSSVMETLVSRCVKIKLAPVPRAQVVEALNKRGFGLKATFVLAGLSGGALGAAISSDSGRTTAIWDNIDHIFSCEGKGQYLQAAFDWTAELATEIDNVGKNDEDPLARANYVSLCVNCRRLWWRDVMVLAATGNWGSLLGPPPSVTQKKWARIITARMICRLEEAMARLTDGLGRPMKVALLIENYWLDVLEYC
ncbi:MAG: DNA polymerase III subunit [Deltaproteobacteria bacterium]|jgi:DNA polymerase-3 subunit delta'|nr:DNA polymerase III subunit [Deltaproteobacteria bacterium]